MSAEPTPVGADPEVARDPELMRGVFQTHLRPLDGTAWEVRDCRVSFARSRAGHRSTFQYTLRLRQPGTGRQWHRLVTGVIYGKDRGPRAYRELEQSGPAPAVPGAAPALAPFFYVPELGMLGQVFPFDHRLPALARLMAGPPPELVPPLLAHFGLGEWRLEAWEAEPVRYRVDMRAMVRVTARARDAATGRAEERRVYAKVYRDEGEGERTDQTLRDLGEKAEEGFAVARPIAYLSGIRTLLQEEVPGARLLDILRGGEDAIPAVRRAAAAVAALHLSGVVPPQRRPLAGELPRLERAGELLRSARPRLGPVIDETVAVVVAGLDDIAPVPTHFDLKPGHILLDGDRVGILDFDKLAASDPLLDVAGLLVDLAKQEGDACHGGDRPGAFARAFAEEYFARVPAAWCARLPLHHAMACLREAAGTGRGLKERKRTERPRRTDRGEGPDGPDRVETLVLEARASVAGRIW